MKKIIIILLSFVAFNLGAQEKILIKKEAPSNQQQKLVKDNKAEVIAKTETKKLNKELNLSTEQQKRVYDIFLDYFENELKRKEATKTLVKSIDKENKKVIKQKIAKQKSDKKEVLNTKLKEILTTEQFEKYQEKINVE